MLIFLFCVIHIPADPSKSVHYSKFIKQNLDFWIIVYLIEGWYRHGNYLNQTITKRKKLSLYIQANNIMTVIHSYDPNNTGYVILVLATILFFYPGFQDYDIAFFFYNACPTSEEVTVRSFGDLDFIPRFGRVWFA